MNVEQCQNVSYKTPFSSFKIEPGILPYIKLNYKFHLLDQLQLSQFILLGARAMMLRKIDNNWLESNQTTDFNFKDVKKYKKVFNLLQIW